MLISNTFIVVGAHNTEPNYVATIPMVQEQHYDTIQTSTALCHTISLLENENGY